jgi:hypothetical protein
MASPPFNHGALCFHRSPAAFALDRAGNSLGDEVLVHLATNSTFGHGPDDTVPIAMHAHRQHEPVPPEKCCGLERIGGRTGNSTGQAAHDLTSVVVACNSDGASCPDRIAAACRRGILGRHVGCRADGRGSCQHHAFVFGRTSPRFPDEANGLPRCRTEAQRVTTPSGCGPPAFAFASLFALCAACFDRRGRRVLQREPGSLLHKLVAGRHQRAGYGTAQRLDAHRQDLRCVPSGHRRVEPRSVAFTFPPRRATHIFIPPRRRNARRPSVCFPRSSRSRPR